jgi:hypothetical protein
VASRALRFAPRPWSCMRASASARTCALLIQTRPSYSVYVAPYNVGASLHAHDPAPAPPAEGMAAALRRGARLRRAGHVSDAGAYTGVQHACHATDTCHATCSVLAAFARHATSEYSP